MEAKYPFQLIASRDGSVHDANGRRPTGPCLGYVRRLGERAWEATSADGAFLGKGVTRRDVVQIVFDFHQKRAAEGLE